MSTAPRRPHRAFESDATHDWVCLVYHEVQPHVVTAGGGPDRFAVSLGAFTQMLDAIAEHNYLGCSVSRATAQRGRRRVALTFDDGTRGQYDYALPALIERGMTATFYVATDWIGQPGYMTWDELRDLVASGMSVQSHTCCHPFLSELDETRLRAELRDSKRLLDAELRQDTREIAFPGGDPPADRLRHLLRECGYRTALGTRWGVNRDPELERPLHAALKRCTAPGAVTPEHARRVIGGDPVLNLGSWARESVLRGMRSTLGATRYSQWRRRVLDGVAVVTR